MKLIVSKIEFSKLIAKVCFESKNKNDVIKLQKEVIEFSERFEISCNII